jgi:glycosyltransferase involved in cell wall biosynthesis
MSLQILELDIHLLHLVPKGCGKAIKWTLAYNEGRSEAEKLKLLIAGKDPDNEEARAYFDSEMAPYLGNSIRFIGPIGGQDKIDFLSRAIALLFPIQWEEPFGLVAIEAMAAGTPVIAKARGGVKETVINGRTGFWVYSTQEAVEAITKVVVGEISREDCQVQARQFETGMVDSYLEIYHSLLATNA